MTTYLVLHHYCLMAMDLPFSEGYSVPGGPSVSSYIDLCLENKDEFTSILVNQMSIKEHDFFSSM